MLQRPMQELIIAGVSLFNCDVRNRHLLCQDAIYSETATVADKLRALQLVGRLLPSLRIARVWQHLHSNEKLLKRSQLDSVEKATRAIT